MTQPLIDSPDVKDSRRDLVGGELAENKERRTVTEIEEIETDSVDEEEQVCTGTLWQYYNIPLIIGPPLLYDHPLFLT